MCGIINEQRFSICQDDKLRAAPFGVAERANFDNAGIKLEIKTVIEYIPQIFLNWVSLITILRRFNSKYPRSDSLTSFEHFLQ